MPIVELFCAAECLGIFDKPGKIGREYLHKESSDIEIEKESRSMSFIRFGKRWWALVEYKFEH